MFTKIKELISGVTRNEQDVIIHGLQSEISRLNRIVASVEGGYCHVANRLDECEHDKKKLQGLLSKADAQIFDLKSSKATLKIRNKALQSRLDQIASLETPSANGTSKKMAKIARGEL